jgi:protein-disulfide isomerase
MEDEQLNPNITRKERIELRRRERKLEGGDLNKGSRRVLIWVVAVIIIGGSIFGVIKLAGKNNVSVDSGSALYAAVGASDWILGNKSAKTVLVEYSDYQCPACALFYPVVRDLVASNSANIEFVYRNFPLAQHANSRLSAYAVEAAGKQYKFWEMHDLVFTNQSTWSESLTARDIFIGYARTLKLDINQFNKDMDSQEIKDKVEADYQSGIKSGVNSTPSFYLNGKKMAPSNSFDEFRKVIIQSIGSN